jgi:hypothetical protein
MRPEEKWGGVKMAGIFPQATLTEVISNLTAAALLL